MHIKGNIPVSGGLEFDVQRETDALIARHMLDESLWWPEVSLESKKNIASGEDVMEHQDV